MKSNRKRYIYFKVHQEGPPITDRQLNNAIWKSMLSLFGELVVADARLFLNEYDEQEGTGYLQCNADRLHQVISSASLLESVENTRISFEPRKTSGTIKALLRK